MRYLNLVLVVMGCMMCNLLNAQTRDNEERKEEQQEKKANNRNKVDYTVFRRQILTLPEFDAEKKKLSELRKQTGGVPKIYAVVDSLNDADDSKQLIGYIVATLGDNTANVYEITFDRVQRKIVKVKPTGEQLEAERPDVVERRDKNAKPPSKKKKTDDEDEDAEDEDEPEEKQERRKQKDEDD